MIILMKSGRIYVMKAEAIKNEVSIINVYFNEAWEDFT